MADREEFVNRTQGWVGIMTINRKGDEVAGVVEPGGRVFLSEEEVTLTARAHRRREDSPFVAREILHFDGLTGDVTDKFVAPLLERIQPEDAEPAKAKAEAKAEAPARRARTTTRRKAGTAVAT